MDLALTLKTDGDRRLECGNKIEHCMLCTGWEEGCQEAVDTYRRLDDNNFKLLLEKAKHGSSLLTRIASLEGEVRENKNLLKTASLGAPILKSLASMNPEMMMETNVYPLIATDDTLSLVTPVTIEFKIIYIESTPFCLKDGLVDKCLIGINNGGGRLSWRAHNLDGSPHVMPHSSTVGTLCLGSLNQEEGIQPLDTDSLLVLMTKVHKWAGKIADTYKIVNTASLYTYDYTNPELTRAVAEATNYVLAKKEAPPFLKSAYIRSKEDWDRESICKKCHLVDCLCPRCGCGRKTELCSTCKSCPKHCRCGVVCDGCGRGEDDCGCVGCSSCSAIGLDLDVCPLCLACRGCSEAQEGCQRGHCRACCECFR